MEGRRRASYYAISHYAEATRSLGASPLLASWNGSE